MEDFKKGIWGMKKISEEEKEIEKELVRNAGTIVVCLYCFLKTS